MEKQWTYKHWSETEDRHKSCKGCLCRNCVNADCEYVCAAHFVCDFKVTNCKKFKEGS